VAVNKSEEVRVMEQVLRVELPLSARIVLNLLIKNAHSQGVAEGALASGVQVELTGDLVEDAEVFDEEAFDEFVRMRDKGLL
jgi:hypothetical protein